MRMSMTALFALSLAACTIETVEGDQLDGCEHDRGPGGSGAGGSGAAGGDDENEDGGGSGSGGAGSGNGGASSGNGGASSGNGGAGSGATAGAAGSGIGDAAVETCEDLGDEASCLARGGCEPIYAGVDCSCGPDCECSGGEPGCICESFEFFECIAAPNE